MKKEKQKVPCRLRITKGKSPEHDAITKEKYNLLKQFDTNGMRILALSV